MDKRIPFLLASTLMLSCVLIFASGCKNSPNRHVWILPNNEKIEYYEGPIDPGFTANIPQYVTWMSDKRGTNNFNVGVGGSYKSLTLHLNKSQTVAWITGLDAGQAKPEYVAVIDVANFKIVGGDCMWSSESHSNPFDIKLKHEVELSSATASVVEEQRKQ